MGKGWFFIVIFAVICAANADSVKHRIFPTPQEFSEGESVLVFDACEFDIKHNQEKAKIDVNPIIKKYKSRIFGKFLECPDYFLSKRILNIEVNTEIQEYFPAKIEDTDESYSLIITETEITLTANQYSGLVHGLETFSRLIKPSNDRKYVIENVPITIQDSPRFSYRGVMVDTARHFIGAQSIMRVIDGMAMAKLNVLHWHIVDDDSFPMESLSFPSLTNYTAFSLLQTYLKEEIQSIVAYANTNAIRIIPEFDNPGHTRSIGLDPAFNALVTCFNTHWDYSMPSGPKIQGGPPTGALDPSNNATYSLISGIFQDLNFYFPDSYVHLGGDEVIFSCWSSVPSIVQFMQQNKISTYQNLMNYYINKARGVLSSVNSTKTALYWLNEATFYLQVKSTDILEYWGLSANISKLATLYPNNKIVIAPSDVYYMDCGMGNPYGGISWCDPYHSWWSIYLLEPTQYLSANQILGGEVPMWAELVNDWNIDGKIWPRAAALAERYWNQNSKVNVPSIVTSLNSLIAAMNAQGIGASPITGHYCEINGSFCFSTPA